MNGSFFLVHGRVSMYMRQGVKGVPIMWGECVPVRASCHRGFEAGGQLDHVGVEMLDKTAICVWMQLHFVGFSPRPRLGGGGAVGTFKVQTGVRLKDVGVNR